MPRIPLDEFLKGLEETKSESDRAAAIVGATMLETILEECILLRLRPMSNTHRESLLGGESSFASFSAKIDLGFSLGLYGQKTKSDLNFIRKIRNEFAHHVNRDFAHSDVTKHCKELSDYAPRFEGAEGALKKIDEYHAAFPRPEMRWRFLFATIEIGNKMLKESSENPSVPRGPTFLP